MRKAVECDFRALGDNEFEVYFENCEAVLNKGWRAMRKVLFFVCSAVLALGLAGCAGKGKVPIGKGKAPVVHTRG